MSETPWKKKLIEVALPLDAINTESAREKSIRHGHPSTLHLWWARRPLAACRAVLFAQLVDDPSAHPEQFATEEAQDAERERLFKIIEDLVKWENSTNEKVLEAARAEIRKSCDGNPPPILDPFAGGGSIPLEAQRLGLEARASDLNPIAVLINKALVEIPPKWANRPPVHPEAENRTRWSGAEGLAEDVRRYGIWIRDEAEKRVGHLYPKATLPDGARADVIAWIWARTVICPNPACGATMPLIHSMWLGKKPGKEAWAEPISNGKAIRFEVRNDPRGPAREGTVTRAGAVCLCCGTAVPFEHIRSEGRAARIGSQLMAVAAEGDRRRVYLSPTDEQVDAAMVPTPSGFPEGELFDWPGRINVVRYGLTEFRQLFTNRQLVVLIEISSLIYEAVRLAQQDGVSSGLTTIEATERSRHIAVYLTFALDRILNESCTICTWVPSPSKEHVKNAFGRQALPMTWDFAESRVFGESTGSFRQSVFRVAEVLSRVPAAGVAASEQRDARHPPDGRFVVATDPPYYDNIGYADLADFFYVWARKALVDIESELFETLLTPKSGELIANQHRMGGSSKEAERYFEEGFVSVFSAMKDVTAGGFPMSVFYAFKQTEEKASDEAGVASTGWATMLEGLLAAGWAVTATWPMRTERSVGLKSKDNVLASSVVLACRQRPLSAGVTDRQGLVRLLREELPKPLRDLQKAHIAPVDLRQAAIGPGMAVFSRFARVIEPDGSTMRVRTALGLINQVLDQVLGEQEAEFDAETRWAIHWFTQFLLDEGPYGVAEQLAVSMNVAVSKMVGSGILASGGGKARLLGRDELADDWDPARDLRTPVWEATQHLVKRLESDGEASAARLLRRLGGLGESAHLLAYRLYTACETNRPTLAGPYNALVASWPEIQRLAREAEAPITVAEQQSFDA